MNPMQLKPLVQAKHTDTEDKISVTLLVTAEMMRSLLSEMERSDDKRSAAIIELTDVELVLEVYQPGESKNLRYTKNLQRPDWKTLSVATL